MDCARVTSWSRWWSSAMGRGAGRTGSLGADRGERGKGGAILLVVVVVAGKEKMRSSANKTFVRRRRRALHPPPNTSSRPVYQLDATGNSSQLIHPRLDPLERAQRQDSSPLSHPHPPLLSTMTSSSNPVDLASLAILSKCTRNACGTSFDPAANTTDACSFHPGVPVFREGLKSWSCCATTKRGKLHPAKDRALR
jgi:hypothetical protein